MHIQLSTLIPGQVEEVFDVLDDPSSAIEINEHAAEHVTGFAIVETRPDGRRTVDVQMQAGRRAWVYTIEQVIRDRPTKLVTRAWTWTETRTAPLLTVTVDRNLTARSGGTQLTVDADFRLANPSLLQRVRLWLQRETTRAELEHSLYLLVAHFAARDSR